MLGNVVAFQDYDPYVSDNGIVSILHSPWVGFDNFQRIFDGLGVLGRGRATPSCCSSSSWCCTSPSRSCSRCSSTAWSRPRVRALSQAILYLPHFFSWVLVVTVFQQMFGGAGHALADCCGSTGTTAST